MSVFGLVKCKLCGCREGEEGVSLFSYNHYYGPSMDDHYAIEFQVRCLECGLSVTEEYGQEVINKWNLLNDQ